MKKTKHICCVIAVVALFLCHFALCAENNDSQLMGIDRKEFTRVISGIIDSGAEGNDDISRENEETVAEDDYVANSHSRSMMHKGDLREAAVQSRKGLQNKRDSLYFLQRSMQLREGTDPSHSSLDYDYREGGLPNTSRGGSRYSPRLSNMARYSPRSQQVRTMKCTIWKFYIPIHKYFVLFKHIFLIC